ncbi:Conjugative transfer protein TrbN (plasmid) [Methylophaga frappieri]|uniref:Conjugative transfer protein TrbN n=2 Tax=Gammaproteobacteria TaxID=1236 RepID=I1YLQ0_METFJ|nr:Conjugative transfer protein TrbN [Methylophaga frappieri]
MQQVIQEAARIEADSSIEQSGRQGQGSYSPSQQSGYVPRTITFSAGAGQ